MTLSLLLALQAATPMVTDSGVRDFDLKYFEPARDSETRRRCASGGDNEEVVVCALRRQSRRIEPLPDIYDKGPLVAETRLFGKLTGNVHAVQDERSGEKGIMVGIKLPF